MKSFLTNRGKYSQFCLLEKHLSIFSKDWYLDAVYGKNNWNVAIVEQNKKIIAALPYALSQKFFFKYIKGHSFAKMLGIYILPQLRNTKREKKLVKVLLEQLPDVHFFEQNFHYSFKNWLPLFWKGYQQTTRYSYIINDLQNLDQVWKNISPVYRNNKIKKTQQNIHIQHDLSIEQFYTVNKLSFLRQKMKMPYSLDALKKLDRALQKHNARKLFFALDKKEQIHSVLYLIWDDQSAYLHFAGDDPQFRNSGAGILLIWEAIKFTSEILKLNRFDFEGSMLESVEQVRRSFGATQISYFTIKKFKYPFLKLIYDLKKMTV